MKLEIDLDQLVDELATLVARRLEERFGSPERSPWMGMAEAITRDPRALHRAGRDVLRGHATPAQQRRLHPDPEFGGWLFRTPA
jgi:hypothetical protein